MRDSKKTEFRVGVTVFVSILLLLWIFGWAKDISFSSDEKIINVTFPNVAGLSEGDQVTINGVRKGLVEELKLDGNIVRVKLKLDEDAVIYSDARFSVMMLDLMGGKKVEINPGTSGNIISYDVVHEGNFSGDVATAFATLHGLEGNIVRLVTGVEESMNKLNRILDNDKLFSNAEELVVELNRLSGKLNGLVDENRDDIRTLLENGNELTQNLNALIDNNEGTISSALTGLDTLSNNVNRLVTKVNSFMEKTETKDNTLGYLINNKEVVRDIQEISRQLKELTSILIEQLKNDGVNVDANIF